MNSFVLRMLTSVAREKLGEPCMGHPEISMADFLYVKSSLRNFMIALKNPFPVCFLALSSPSELTLSLIRATGTSQNQTGEEAKDPGIRSPL